MHTKLLLLIGCAVLLGCNADQQADSSSGQAGSTTRFAIQNGYMYVIENSSIHVFGLADGTFTSLGSVETPSGMETVFPNGEYLYLGARDGMYIYSISTPHEPTFVFRYQHIVSCDPVVVQGNRAYVTLSSGSGCNLGVNALEIIDISNPMNPTLVKNYPMASPRGLAVTGDLLFICEADYGLQMWDISDEHDIQLVHQVTDISAYDVIARDNVATVTGDEGIFQYSYASGAVLELLSALPVTRDDG